MARKMEVLRNFSRTPGELSRRDFLKGSAAVSGGLLAQDGKASTPPQESAKLARLKDEVAREVQARQQLTQQMVDSIFSFAELGFQEFDTSAYVTEILKKEGFEVTREVAGMPTAFVATWGSGKPVIGFMADLDCLPQCSQKPGVAYHDPLIVGGPGHGEGHNAGQAVNVTAALAVKQLMQKYQIPGTLHVYPGIAEELIGSRTYMVNAGLLRELDVMLSAHIANQFTTMHGPSGTGLVSTWYNFHGRSAHAASAWQGRSALDAAELMDVAWTFRREHLRPEQRSHRVIVNGGDQPNVVPPEATVWYYFREWDYERIRDLHDLGTKLANAAATMTDTTMTERILSATWPGHFNKPLAEALYANINRVGMPEWSGADQALAHAAQAELKAKLEGLKTTVTEMNLPENLAGAASDDIAEVSWNMPTVVLRYPGNIPGMIGHNWSSAIAMATPIAHKGSTAGAKAQAMTALDLLLTPELLEAARRYFAEQTKTTKWVSLIPEGTTPPIELNRDKMEKFRPQLQKLRYDPSRFATYLEQLGIQYPTVREAGNG
jgi:aminobenzoyl-glutamate utilization protein B